MLQYYLSVIRNMTRAKTSGMSELFICDADKYAPILNGTGNEIKAWNRSFRQSCYIPI